VGDRRAATRTAKAWLAGHPDDVRMRRRLAQLHAELGEGDAAVAVYKAVLERSYACALAATGAREEARRLLLPIAEKPFAGAEAVQELLESLQ
jgi:hypothetical protein